MLSAAAVCEAQTSPSLYTEAASQAVLGWPLAERIERTACGHPEDTYRYVDAPSMSAFDTDHGRFSIRTLDGRSVDLLVRAVVEDRDGRFTVHADATETGGTFTLTRFVDGHIAFQYRDPRVSLRFSQRVGGDAGILYDQRRLAECAGQRQTTTPACANTFDGKLTARSSNGFTCASDNTTACAAKVLHVFPETTRDMINNSGFGPIEDLVFIDFTAQANEALRASGVQNKSVQSEYEIVPDLLSGPNTSEGYVDELVDSYAGGQIGQLVDAYRADAVIYYGEYASTTPGQVGRANLQFEGAFAASAPVAWVSGPDYVGATGQSATFQFRTAIHEFGHLLGLTHERGTGPGQVAPTYTGCDVAYVSPAGDRATVMATQATAASDYRLPRFSNPNLTFPDGSSAGATDAYAARYAARTFCTIAAVESGGTFFALPNQRRNVRKGSNCVASVDLRANPFELPAGVTYEWRYSTAGPIFSAANPGVAFSTSRDSRLSVDGTQTYAQVRITDPATGDAYRASLRIDYGSYLPCPQGTFESGFERRANSVAVPVGVYDVYGRLLGRFALDPAVTAAELGLAPGAYFVRDADGRARKVVLR